MKRFFNGAAACSIIVLMSLFSTAAFAATGKSSQMPASGTKLKAKASAAPSALSGKVVETMNAGGYTYVCLEKKGKKTWVAVPEMQVSVGQVVAFQQGQEMVNFKSKSLNRTFDSIIFSGGPASPQSSKGMPAAQGGPANHEGSKAAAAPADKDAKVEKAAGADAYTVGEVFEKRKVLDKKTIVVRGKVVKVSKGIMGTNWIHLQDGTGDMKKSTHDLVVTSEEAPSVGDIVTVKGTVSKDKDFGAGYKYSAIIEKASVQH
ncbi:MAG: OB-fold nucleic acid binding domain-containing protein [Betaproteobacteria bacterium]